jgi:5'-methylthioadenosine phosphorylase
MMADFAIIASQDVDTAALLTDAAETQLDAAGGPVPAVVGKLHGSDLMILYRNASGRPVAPHVLDYRANIEALARAGVRRVVTTAMVGSLRPSLPVGTGMVLDQFIDFTHDRRSTYFSGHDFGHADMAEPYCPDLRQLLIQSTQALDIPVTPHGCYVCTAGPRFETRAEVRMFALLGGDVVGFTNVTECVMAREAGLCYATYAGVVNLGAGLSDQELRTESWRHARAVHATRFGAITAELAKTLAGSDRTCRCATSATIERPPR